MPFTLGPLLLDDATALKQLRADMKDDWFADPLNYSDMIETPLLFDLIQENFTFNNGQYISTNCEILNLPKSNFTLRYAMETSLSDRFLFHALTAELVPIFDKLLGPYVYSHRYDYSKPKARYLFKRAIPAWNDFIGSVGAALTETKYLLSTDLANYYETVNLALLKDQLKSLLTEVDENPAEKSKARAIIDELFRCLSKWAVYDNRGLPQNRDASSFLANIYMLPIDRAMQSLGYNGKYFRYMDDIKIICESEFSARKALKELTLSLRKHGLSVNAKKTKILPGSDKEKVGACLEEAPATVSYLHSIWSTNNPKLILSKIGELHSATQKVLQEGDFSSKQFRFCIGRLCTLLKCDNFAVPDKFFEEITPRIIDGLTKMPAATDQIAKYLRAAPLKEEHLGQIAEFLLDGERAIYSWQNYHLWVVLTDRKHKSNKLLDHARQNIENGLDRPNRAGASLYSGAVGKEEDRHLIAKCFPAVKSFHGQRMALIGLHEVPFSPLVEQYVKPNVRPDLKGVYKQLRQKKGHYCHPLETIVLGEETYEGLES